MAISVLILVKRESVWVFLEIKAMPREQEAQWWLSMKMCYSSLLGKTSSTSFSEKEMSDFNSTIPSMYHIGLSLFTDGMCWAYASSPKVLQEEAVFGGSCLYKMAEGSSL
jgi:hypothetical protein